MNQVTPTSSAGCTFCQAINYVFEEYLVFLAHQILLENMNAAFTRPANNPYSSPIIPGGEITQISHGAQTTVINQSQNSPTISNNLLINKNFPTKVHPFFKIHIWNKTLKYGKKGGHSN